MLKLSRMVGYIGIGVDLLVYFENKIEGRGQLSGTVIYLRCAKELLYDAMLEEALKLLRVEKADCEFSFTS